MVDVDVWDDGDVVSDMVVVLCEWDELELLGV